MTVRVPSLKMLMIGAAASLCIAGAPSSSVGQTVQEAAALAEGWSLLAKGATAEASGYGAALLARYPENASVLAFSVQAEIARGGALAGLSQYEGWLGRRVLDDVSILSNVATALLWEQGAGQSATSLDALRALATHGHTQALAVITDRAAKGGGAEARALAAAGDERSIKVLADGLGAGTANALEIIRVLGESRSSLALPALLAQARSAEPAVRQAAMTSLGQLGGGQVLAVLRAGLQDSVGMVRGQAAGALYRLGDDSGMALLRELASSDAPAGRLAAAQHLAARPNAEWQTLVRGLTQSGIQSDVRLSAAKLLNSVAPDEAARVFQALAADPAVDLAVREDASRTAAAASSDPAWLRSQLRSADPSVRVGAAAAILALARR